jgi:hypothetical protein
MITVSMCVDYGGTAYFIRVNLLAKPSVGDHIDFGVNNSDVPESIREYCYGTPAVFKVIGVEHKIVPNCADLTSITIQVVLIRN